ncbi:hypothetical protein SAMN04489726_6577 [Allokutzneria albata]|uniref:Uncharacterized protein n=1 Tax=Allokutzneria albata TaxID=211114 RepID=A0A1H0BB96_ALLAB|nr:hypothetical protein SAMN04489726_6577 [Allokutzneria albata]
MRAVSARAHDGPMRVITRVRRHAWPLSVLGAAIAGGLAGLLMLADPVLFP